MSKHRPPTISPPRGLTGNDAPRHLESEIEERGNDALDGSEHGSYAEREQHEEEEHRPDGTARHADDGLGEDHERQARALRLLLGNTK